MSELHSTHHSLHPAAKALMDANRVAFGTPDQWFDVAAPGENLRRLLLDREVTITGDEEIGQYGATFTVADVRAVVTGIDRNGFFAGVEVTSTRDSRYTLYANGQAMDDDDDPMGRWSM